MAVAYSCSIIKRETKKGIVYDARFRIFDNDGYLVQKRLCGYSTQKLAKKAYLEFMKTYEEPSVRIDTTKTTLCYDDLINPYLAACTHNNSLSTAYERRKVFDRIISPYFAGKTMAYFTKKNLILFQDYLFSLKKADGNQYSYAYIMKIRGFLGAFLSWATERYDTPNLLSRIKMPPRQTGRTEMLIMEESEFKTFISAVDNVMWKTFFIILFYTGVRVGELVSMSDDKISNGKITVSTSLTRKTLDGSVYQITIPKNKKKRVNDLPDVVINQVSEYLEWKRINQIPSTFLFCGDKPLNENLYQRALTKYTELSAVKKIRIHDFRHSFVSLLLHYGASFPVVASLIGDTLEQTVRTYSHLYDSDKTKISKLIGNSVP